MNVTKTMRMCSSSVRVDTQEHLVVGSYGLVDVFEFKNLGRSIGVLDYRLHDFSRSGLQALRRHEVHECGDAGSEMLPLIDGYIENDERRGRELVSYSSHLLIL